MFLHECFEPEKCLDTGVELCSFLFSTLRKCSYILCVRGLLVSYVLEATFRTVNDVNQITELTSNFTFWCEILLIELLLGAKATDTV